MPNKFKISDDKFLIIDVQNYIYSFICDLCVFNIPVNS